MSAPVNDDLANATVFTGGTVITSNAGATTQDGEDKDIGADIGHVGATIWYEYTPVTSGTVNFDTTNLDRGVITDPYQVDDTTLQAYHETSGDVNFTTLDQVAENDDSNNSFAAVQFDVTAGEHYFLQLGGYEGESGVVHLTEVSGPEAVACYLRGTMILTPDGEVAIEDLDIADTVVTASGEQRAIKWIGRRSYALTPQTAEHRPIRIAAGALGENRPARDLYVSPRHAMLLDDVLIEARWLVNGTTITQPRPDEDVHYFHIELDSHDCVIAEGAASETFLAIPDRHRFDNAAEFTALYPGECVMPNKPSCAPRVQDGFVFQAIRDRLMPRRAA